MKKHVRRNHQLPCLIATICLLFVFLLPAQTTSACSSDYLIWMIRSKNADPLYRFARNGKAGYIDQSGKVVIEPRFEVYGNHGGEFHDGLLLLGVGDGPYMDTTGKVVLDKKFDVNWNFSDGLAVATRDYWAKWGYIGRSGEFVISPRFDWSPGNNVHSFSEGMAMIRIANKYGYIDRSGEFVIEPTFLHGTEFQDGMARVVVEGPCIYVGRGPCPDYRTLPAEVAWEAPMCKFTFIDKTGSIISSERYDGAKEFSEGLAPVAVEKKWGYIDKKGRMVIKPKFDDAEPFSDGLALVKQGQLYGYINHTGEYSILPQFESADKFSDGLAAVGYWDSNKPSRSEFYYINKSGEQAFPEKFTIASHFFKGLAHVKLKTKKGEKSDNPEAKMGYAYIDVTGRKVFTY